MNHGALAARVHRLSLRLGERGVPSVGDALRQLREWALSDPEAKALSRELFERMKERSSPDPRYAGVSAEDLQKRFEARLVCAPNARALMKTLAMGPRSSDVP